jgi:hypothetical protein
MHETHHILIPSSPVPHMCQWYPIHLARTPYRFSQQPLTGYKKMLDSEKRTTFAESIGKDMRISKKLGRY